MADKTFRAALILSAIDKMSFVVNQSVNKSITKLDALQNKADKIAKSTRAFGTATFGAGIAAAAGIGYIVKSYAESADKIRKSSEQVGLSVQAYQELNHVANLAGLSQEEFQNSMLKLARNSADAAAGLGRSKAAWSALGISLTDQNGKLRDSESLLPEVSDKLSKVENQNLKTALAIRIFGDSGASMVNMLSDGSAGLTKMREEARKLGIVINEGDARAAEEFNDNIERLMTSLRGFGNIVGKILVPVLDRAVLAMTRVAVIAGNFARENPRLSKTIIVVGGVLTALAIIVGGAALAISGMAWSVGVLSGAFKMLQGIMKVMTVVQYLFNAALWANPITWIIAGIVALGAAAFLVVKYWDPISKFFLNMWEKVKSAFFGFINWAKQNWQIILAVIFPIAAIPLLISKYGKQLFDAGKNIVSMIWNGIKAMASKPVEAIKEIIQKMRDFLPFSPAKTGPFRDLHKVKIAETLAMSIKPAPLVNAMKGLTSAAAMAIPAAQPSTNGVQNYSSPFTVNYSPTVNFSGSAGQSDAQSFGSMLQSHKGEIARILGDIRDNKERKGY